jgi:RNA polymerase sigma-70 factor (ECF subfamily)
MPPSSPSLADEEISGTVPIAGRPEPRASDVRASLAAGPEGAAPEDDVDAPGVELTLDEIYSRFSPYVAAIASRILGRQGEVQDVVHDVFAAAVSGLRYRDNVHQVRSWLAKVAVRSSFKQLRGRRLRNLFEQEREPIDYDLLAAPGASPEDCQLITELYTVLDRIPVKNRVAWTLRYVEGERLEDVAELCGCSLATVKRRIAAAQDRVLKAMGEKRP